jgi:uncharacterized protein YuzE
MGCRIKLFYDKEGDILDIAIGEPQVAISEEIGDDILVRRHPETDEIVGWTILNFSCCFGEMGQDGLSEVRRILELQEGMLAECEMLHLFIKPVELADLLESLYSAKVVERMASVESVG